MVTRTRMKLLSNKAQCKLCGDVIESKHRHDFVWCKCKEIAVDGGLDYIKRCANDFNNVINLSEVIEETYESD